MLLERDLGLIYERLCVGFPHFADWVIFGVRYKKYQFIKRPSLPNGLDLS